MAGHWSVVICLSAHPRNRGFLVERDSMVWDKLLNSMPLNFFSQQPHLTARRATNGPTKVHWDHKHGGGASTRHLGPLDPGSWFAVTGTELAVFSGQGVIIECVYIYRYVYNIIPGT